MTISFCITVCNEFNEFKELINKILKYKREEDNILVLYDLNKFDEDFYEYLVELVYNDSINLISDRFNNDFANWKNKLRDHIMCKQFLLFLDADENISDILIQELPVIAELNPDFDVFAFARINTVENIGLSDVNSWGWNISKLEQFSQEKIFNLEEQEDLDQYNLLKKYNLIIEENIV